MTSSSSERLFSGKNPLKPPIPFRTGEAEASAHDSPIAFTGLMFELESPTTIPPSHQMYEEELPIMDLSGYLSNHGITNPTAMKSTFNQGLGALIWLHQTRPDVEFAIKKIATRILEDFESPEKAQKVANLYNKIVRFVKNRRRKIIYIEFPSPSHHSPPEPSTRMNWKLFVFQEAVFGTLVQNRSVESHVVALGGRYRTRWHSQMSRNGVGPPMCKRFAVFVAQHCLMRHMRRPRRLT